MLPHVGDQLVLLGDQCRQIDRTHLGRHARAGMESGVVVGVRCSEQRLGRNAADTDAGAADGGAFDQDSPCIVAAGFNCGREGRTTRTDHC